MLKARSSNPLPPVVVDLLKSVGFKAWRFHYYHRAVPVLKLLVDLADDDDAAVMLSLSLLSLGEDVPDALENKVRQHPDAQLAAHTLQRLALYRAEIRARQARA
ncbi:MAG: hypothetical protein RIR70_1981 [Pseudomonadota bacterium]|jgi:hypothetical protein